MSSDIATCALGRGKKQNHPQVRTTAVKKEGRGRSFW